MTAEILALLDSDPAAGILAAADLREQRATCASSGPYTVVEAIAKPRGLYELRIGPTWRDPETGDEGQSVVAQVSGDGGGFLWLLPQARRDAEHIAAEANPAHALAAVRRWRGVVGRHQPFEFRTSGGGQNCECCRPGAWPNWPCPDLTETADEARAYLGGAS